MKTLLKTDWMQVGKEYLKTDKDTATVLNEKDRLKWMPLVNGMSLPFMQGSAIKNAIKELGLPKVSAIAYGGGFGLSVEPGAGYGFYGIEANYKDCVIRIHLLDNGCSCTPLFIDVYSKD